MSTFTVSPQSLSGLASAMGQFAGQVQALDLGTQAFGGLMGGDDVEGATADFCQTMATGVKSLGLTMEVLTYALQTGAAKYGQCDQSIAGACSPTGP